MYLALMLPHEKPNLVVTLNHVVPLGVHLIEFFFNCVPFVPRHYIIYTLACLAWIVYTALEKDNGFTFNIFPNPNNNGRISFIYDANRIYDNNSIDIFNINGELIKSLHLKDSGFNMKNISLEGMDSGIYIVCFTNGNDKITKKLVIN